MILILVAFAILVIVFVWGYMISLDFMMFDFSAWINQNYQSNIVNKENYKLTSSYISYFNSGINDNDYKCYSWWTFEDLNCAFKWTYWFIPPNQTIDLGIYQNLSWDWIILNLTWDLNKWTTILIRSLESSNFQRYNLNNTWNVINYKLKWDYNFKITNKSNSWLQYYMYFTGNEWINYKIETNSGYIYLYKDFSSNFWGNKILNIKTSEKLTLPIYSCQELSSFTSILSWNYFIRPTTLSSWTTWYCHIDYSGNISTWMLYSWSFDDIPKVSLLLQSEDANGSTWFVDSSLTGDLILTGGTVQHSKTQTKFWNSSILFNGSTDYLTIVNSTDFDLWTADFTIDMWINPAISTNYQTILSKGFYTTGNNWNFLIRINPTLGNVNFLSYNDQITPEIITWTTTLTIWTWYHLTFIRETGVLKIYNNWTLIGSWPLTKSIWNNTANLSIWKYDGWSGNIFFNWYMEEIRIVKWKAMRTWTFTAPNLPYKF